MYGNLNIIFWGHIKAFNLTKFFLKHEEIKFISKSSQSTKASASEQSNMDTKVART